LYIYNYLLYLYYQNEANKMNHDGQYLPCIDSAELYLELHGIEKTHSYNKAGKGYVIREKIKIEFTPNNETEWQRINKWMILKDKV